MRTLKYAILGLINHEPMTGYDITKEFNSNQLANFWYAKHSQVYPELGKLMDEGLVTSEIVIQGEKLEKKLYTITQKGIDEFRTWLMLDEELPPTPKDVFRLRIYFSEFMSETELYSHLEKQLAKHHTKRHYLSEIMEKSHGFQPPAFGTRAYGDFMVLEGAIMRETSYIQWVETCLKRLHT